MLFGRNTEELIRDRFSLNFYKDERFLQNLRQIISLDAKVEDIINSIEVLDLSSYKAAVSATSILKEKRVLIDTGKDLDFYKGINKYNKAIYLAINTLIDILHESVHLYQVALINSKKEDIYRKFLIDSYNVKRPTRSFRRECRKELVLDVEAREEFYDMCHGFFFFERQAYYESSVYLLNILKDIIKEKDILEDISIVQSLFLLYPYLDARKLGISPIEFFYNYAYDTDVKYHYDFSRFSICDRFMLGDYLSHQELINVLGECFSIDKETSRKLILDE